jgi:hypothetical protein
MNSLTIGVIAAVFVVGPAFGQAHTAPDDETLVNTIQCEAGKAGVALGGATGPADKMKVVVSWVDTATNDWGGGLGFKIPFFPFGGSGDLTSQEIESLESDGLRFNLHPDNQAACKNKKIIRGSIGVYDCLVKKKRASFKAALAGGAGSATCRHQITITKKLSANARFLYWFVDAGVNGSWGDSRLFKFVVAAPPPVK